MSQFPLSCRIPSRSWRPRALAAALAAVALAACPTASRAEPTVVFDGSLGPAGPAPTRPFAGGGFDYRIAAEQGQRVDAALFHSFSELGVREGDAASFTGPDAIDQIFARVTGGHASQIDGLLRSEVGSAELYLMNPSGILFGEGARLDVDGSFHATTADELRFADCERFEARAGGALPRLVVAPVSAFGFLAEAPAPIRVEGGTLSLAEGETLSLVGGPIEVEGGLLAAPGGRVNLAGVGSPGEVKLGARDAAEPLEVSSFARLAPVAIGARSIVNASGVGERPPGDIFVRGSEVVVERAQVLAEHRSPGPGGRISIAGEASVTLRGTLAANGRGGARGGDIDIRAPKLEIDGGSVAAAAVRSVVVGGRSPGGTIRIRAGAVVLRNGAMLSAESSTGGDAGTIRIRAGSVVLRDGGALNADSSAGGEAGLIEVKARSLELKDAGWIHASGTSDSDSDGGTLRLDVATLRVSGAGSRIDAMANKGEAGTIEVTARKGVYLSNEHGERLSLSDILARRPVVLTGIFAASDPPTRDAPASGSEGGRITIRAPEIVVGEGTFVATTSLGPHAAGDVVLRGGRIAIVDGGVVDSSALSAGAAGSVRLEATDSITVAGRSALGDAAWVGSTTSGPAAAGTVSLRAPSVRIDDGGRVTTASLPLDGGRFDPAIELPPGPGGPAGEIRVDAARLVVAGGGQIDSSSLSEGAAGDLRLRAGESIEVSGQGSRIATRAGGSGAGGSISLAAPEVTIADGGQVASESAPGLGALAFESLVDEGILATPPAEATGAGGSIEVAAGELRLERGSIQAQSAGSADAGDVRVHAGGIELVDSTISTEATAASGGSIAIEADERLHLVRSAITASVTSGSGGNITISDPQLVLLEEGSRIVAQAGEGSGGNITLAADLLLVALDSTISASSELGIQGTVDIRAPDTDLAGELAELPESFLDAVGLMKERCAARRNGERAGSFVWTGRQGTPASPDGPLPAFAEPAPELAGEPAPGLVAALLVERSARKPLGLLLGCG
jgi:filamentous hemagglutinin family protein